LVSYGKRKAAAVSKEMRFTLTTNGVLLDREVTAFMNREGIKAVLSLDGRQETHDAMRSFPGGRGSYTEILSRLSVFVAARDNRDYYVRGTFTAQNLDFSRDVMHLADLGFTELSVEPVVAGPEAEYALLPAHLPIILAEYERLTEDLLARQHKGAPVNFFHFNINLFRSPCLPRRLTGCGAGSEYMAVTPDGELYPCHQFVGKKEFLLGDVYRGVTDLKLRQRFREAHVLRKSDCRGCWARWFCSGGCHANNHIYNGDLLKPYVLGCEMQKKRLECGIYMQLINSV